MAEARMRVDDIVNDPAELVDRLNKIEERLGSEREWRLLSTAYNSARNPFCKNLWGAQ